MIRLPFSSASRTQRSASPMRAASSSIGFTYAGAPPCSGPESAPTADDSAAPQSAPVDASHASGERRSVQPVLGRADPVRVDRLDVLRVRFAPPAQQELLGDRRAARDDLVRGRLAAVGDGGGARDDPHHLRREAAEILARLLVRDLVQLAELPLAREPRSLGLEVGRGVAGQLLELARFGVRHRRFEVVVDQQPPDIFVRVAPDELLDIDPAIPERPARELGLGDLRLDGDDALETRLEVVHRGGMYR